MKKLFYILTLNCLLLIPSTRDCYAQPSITWSKIYTPTPFFSDEAYCISNSGSGYFYVGGHTYNSGYLMKIDNYGDTIWSLQPRVGIKTLIFLQDKGCIYSGETDSLRMFRIDSNGNNLWEKKFMQGFIPSTVKDIKRTLDGFYIACGYRDMQQDGLVLKFDENGNLFWMKTYPANYVKTFLSIEITPDNGYLTTGEVIDFDTLKTLLLRLDSAGNVIWEKQYKIFNQPAYGGFIKKTNSGYFIAGGTTDSLSSQNRDRLYFIRVDTAGNIKYEKFFSFYEDDYFYASQFINVNKYIFCSLASMYGGSDTSIYSKVMITDSLGNILVSRNFYSNIYYGFYSVTTANNSDIILAGSIKWSGDDILVCRVDSLLQGPPIGIKQIESENPIKFNLYQNYPNPFNSSTILKFDLPISGNIKLKLYDITGKEILNILNNYLRQGEYKITINMNNEPSGVYFVRLQYDNESMITKKIILIK